MVQVRVNLMRVIAFLKNRLMVNCIRRSCMEQMQCERNKLRNDLLVANERASLLAQEVDDNHARMENSVQQKLK